MSKPTAATLKRALARRELILREAVPTAEKAVQALLAGGELSDVPEHDGELPDVFPYSVLPEHEARQLAFLTGTLPDRAAAIQGLWLSQ